MLCTLIKFFLHEYAPIIRDRLVVRSSSMSDLKKAGIKRQHGAANSAYSSLLK